MNLPTPENADLIVRALNAIAEESPPDAMRAFLIGGILGGFIGVMPEGYWQEFRKVIPCGRPGCDCHIAAQKVIDALEAVRESARRDAGNTAGN